MRILRTFPILLGLTAGLLAQDKVTLSNGDVLTGLVKSMADGKLVINSPVLGDVTVPLSDVTNLATAAPVDLLNNNGELLKRRIAGIEGGQLKLEGDIPALELGNLAKINPPAEEPPKWTGSITVNGNIAKGNTDRRAMGAAFNAIRRTDVDRITADASWDYADNKNPVTKEWELNQRRAGAGLKYDYFISERLYFLAQTRVLGDTLANLNLRFTGGAGVGYQWIDTKTTKFTTEAGLSYLNENYRNNDPSVDFVAARVAYYLQTKLSEDTKLNHSVEAYPSIEKSDDVYFQMRTEVITSLTESMIASLGWIWDYDNTPATGAERSDHRVLLSVGWSF